MNICYIYTRDCPSKLEDTSIHEKLISASIDTLLMYYKSCIEKIYILIDNNISDHDYNSLSNSIKLIAEEHIDKFIFKLIDLNITNIFKYPENNWNCRRINKIGLVKFLIPYLVDCDDILYVDDDILFNIKNAQEDIYKDYDKHTTLFKIFQHGYNSGLILFNCNQWRKEKNLISNISKYYEDNFLTMQFVDNQTFRWLAECDEYKDKVIKDDNWKINFPIWKNFCWEELILNKEYNWKNMYIIHIAGEHYGRYIYKRETLNEIYNYIKEKR